MKVDEEVSIPGVIGGDEEEVFIREILIDGGSFSVRGKIVMSLARTRDFLLLGVENSRSYSGG
jgi:hypothetical protein